MPTPIARFSESGDGVHDRLAQTDEDEHRDHDAFPDDDAHRPGEAEARAKRQGRRQQCR